jgi:ComF family protein
LKNLLRKILGIIYPERCVFCDKILSAKEKYLCDECIHKFKFIKDRTCIRCGRVLHSRYETLCHECASGNFVFDEAFAPFKYTGEVKNSILNLKYKGRAQNAGFYAKCIWKYGKERITNWNPDIIIAVPIHYSRLATRGYNQAELIARKLSEVSGIPLEKNVIARTKKTQAQKKLGKFERHENMKSAFSFVYGDTLPERILIIDDIFTTGATVDAISGILKDNGAKKVYVICAALS